jgi:hypothetical protein
MASTDIVANLTSATGVAAPNFQTGGGVTYLFCEEELMQVLSISGTVATVLRGQFGTAAVAHASGTPTAIGLATDFQNFQPAQRAFQTTLPTRFEGWSTALVGAASNTATGPMFHLTGTTAMVTLLPPATVGFVSGYSITIVFDGSAAGLTWTAAGNIAVAGTSTTAGSAVTFTFDANSTKWHPSRLA